MHVESNSPGTSGPLERSMVGADIAGARLRQVFDGIFTFVGLLTPDGVLTEANRAVLEAAALEPSDVIGKHFAETYWWSWNPSVQSDLRSAIERSAAGESFRHEMTMRVADDTLATIDFALVPVNESGRVTAIVYSGIDISERKRHQERTSSLAFLARRLSAALTTDEVAHIIVESGTEALGAQYANIGLLGDDKLVNMVHPTLLPDDLAQRTSAFSVETARPQSDAIREGRTVFVHSDEEFESLYPEFVADWAASNLRSFTTVPMRDARGAVFGALGVGWFDEVDFDAGLQARVETVADLCAQTLQRTRLADAQSQLVTALQDELLPVIPAVEGLELAVRYLPASGDIGFSGDWYDVVSLHTRCIAVIVGDIAGHGIEAAAKMAQVRGVINTLARMGTDTGELFTHAHALLAHLEDPFIGTAALAMIDMDHEELHYASAGHPPFVLMAPGRRVELLDGARRPALGVPGAPITAETVRFPVGSALVAYTDGLVERRARDLTAVMVGELSLVGDAGAPEVADRLIERLRSGEPLGDDVAMVVVRRTE